MDLNQYLIFAKVAENQSFTKAAAELGLEKSTISTKVTQLEKRIGIRLLNRTTRTVSLTEAGEGFYRYCQQIIENAQEADHYAETLMDSPQGVLRITTPMDFGHLLIQHMIKPFMQAYPRVALDINVTDREIDLTRERFDIALRIGTGTLTDSSLVGKKLLDVAMGFYAAPEYLARQGTPKSIHDLRQHDFIYFSKAIDSVFMLDEPLQNPALPLQGRIKINDVLSCKQAAISGLGITMIPVKVAQADEQSGQLTRVLATFALPTMALFVVYPSRHLLSSKVKVFLHFIEQWQ